MPRLSRTVFAGVPHHVTQRGNRRETVFFTDEDRYAYLDALREYCRKHRVEVLAYCLMSNHIHLIAVPERDDGLERVLRPLHMRHAQRVNRNRGWKGHLWQGRFFSSPLDEQYLWAAIRYVERNPVRAKMVRKAENYAWSSAAGHCGLRKDTLLNESSTWLKQYEGEGESSWTSPSSQSALIFATLTTSAHLFLSDFMKAANSDGEVPDGSIPCARYLARTMGIRSTRLISSLSLSTIS